MNGSCRYFIAFFLLYSLLEILAIYASSSFAALKVFSKDLMSSFFSSTYSWLVSRYSLSLCLLNDTGEFCVLNMMSMQLSIIVCIAIPKSLPSVSLMYCFTDSLIRLLNCCSVNLIIGLIYLLLYKYV